MKTHHRATQLLLSLALLCGFNSGYAHAPVLDPADDARHLGPPDKLLFWTPEQQVAGYRNFRLIYPTTCVTSPGLQHRERSLITTPLKPTSWAPYCARPLAIIWKPFGMEADANWMLSEPGGGEQGGCCINATLRDYGRLGLFAMANGRLADGTQILRESWMAESTTPSKGEPGYGYFWWLYDDGTFRASGIFGQAIYINPKENVVIAMHSARKVASNRSDWALQSAFFTALTKAVKD